MPLQLGRLHPTRPAYSVLFTPPRPAFYKATERAFRGQLFEVADCPPHPPVVMRFVRCQGPATHCVVYAHANSEDLGNTRQEIDEMSRELFVHVLVVEYPGYGISPGPTTVSGISRAVRMGYLFATNVLNVPSRCVILCGRSIGSGPIAELCAELCGKGQSPAAMWLISSFLSIRDIARRFAGPIARLVKQRWKVKRHVQSITCPSFFCHGGRDRIIPVAQGRQLLALSAAKAKHGLFDPEGTHDQPGEICDALMGWMLENVIGFWNPAVCPNLVIPDLQAYRVSTDPGVRHPPASDAWLLCKAHLTPSTDAHAAMSTSTLAEDAAGIGAGADPGGTAPVVETGKPSYVMFADVMLTGRDHDATSGCASMLKGKQWVKKVVVVTNTEILEFPADPRAQTVDDITFHGLGITPCNNRCGHGTQPGRGTMPPLPESPVIETGRAVHGSNASMGTNMAGQTISSEASTLQPPSGGGVGTGVGVGGLRESVAAARSQAAQEAANEQEVPTHVLQSSHRSPCRGWIVPSSIVSSAQVERIQLSGVKGVELASQGRVNPVQSLNFSISSHIKRYRPIRSDDNVRFHVLCDSAMALIDLVQGKPHGTTGVASSQSRRTSTSVQRSHHSGAGQSSRASSNGHMFPNVDNTMFHEWDDHAHAVPHLAHMDASEWTIAPDPASPVGGHAISGGGGGAISPGNITNNLSNVSAMSASMFSQSTAEPDTSVVHASDMPSPPKPKDEPHFIPPEEDDSGTYSVWETDHDETETRQTATATSIDDGDAIAGNGKVDNDDDERNSTKEVVVGSPDSLVEKEPVASDTETADGNNSPMHRSSDSDIAAIAQVMAVSLTAVATGSTSGDGDESSDVSGDGGRADIREIVAQSPHDDGPVGSEYIAGDGSGQGGERTETATDADSSTSDESSTGDTDDNGSAGGRDEAATVLETIDVGL